MMCEGVFVQVWCKEVWLYLVLLLVSEVCCLVVEWGEWVEEGCEYDFDLEMVVFSVIFSGYVLFDVDL